MWAYRHKIRFRTLYIYTVLDNWCPRALRWLNVCSFSNRQVSVVFIFRLAALAKTTTKLTLVWECIQGLGKLSELNKVTSVWISGRQGISGNEEAARLAKEGTTEVPPNQFSTVPFNAGKKLIKKHLEQRHQARWAACTGCPRYKMLMRYPLSSRANELLARSRLRPRAAVGLLIVHKTLRAHR